MLFRLLLGRRLLGFVTVCLFPVVYSQSDAFEGVKRGVNGDPRSLACPTNCSCAWDSVNTGLTVNCQERRGEEQLAEQLDSLLSSSMTYGRLTSLTVANSRLTRVPRSICRLTTLTQLIISRNRIAELPGDCINNLTRLIHFAADENNITELQDGVFDGMSALTILRITRNNIRSVGLSVFNGSAGLIGMRGVWLSHNNLTTLEPWFYYVAINGKSRNEGTEINLYKNQISTFTNEMGLRFSCSGTKPMYGTFDLGHNRLRHFTDMLRGWRISGSELLCMMHFRDSHPSLQPRIHENPLDCDCKDYTFYYPVTFFAHYNLFKNVRCDKPWYLYDMPVNSVPPSQFVCEVSRRCPSGCRCVNRPWNATLHIYCSNTNLTRLPADLPDLPNHHTKYKLDFFDNRLLRRLGFRKYFAKSWAIDISNSDVDSVDNITVWTAIVHIPTVNMFGNQVASLPPSFASVNVTTERLNLAGDRWDCSCENQWMSKWLQSIQDRLTQDVRCHSPARMRGKNILDTGGAEFCEDPESQAAKRAWIVSLSSVAGVLLVLLTVGGVVYRLRTKLYTRWKFHPFDRDECLGEDLDYDVFLCSSSLDDEPRSILETLEQVGYRVCIHDRDFRPGVIFDNIELAVTRSKRVVCVLTENFLCSSYCMHEFDTALGHFVRIKRTRRLVVLMALDRPIEQYADDADCDTAALRQYLHQYTYIDYAADDWLDKLIYALPLRGMSAERNGEDDVDPLL